MEASSHMGGPLKMRSQSRSNTWAILSADTHLIFWSYVKSCRMADHHSAGLCRCSCSIVPLSEPAWQYGTSMPGHVCSCRKLAMTKPALCTSQEHIGRVAH